MSATTPQPIVYTGSSDIRFSDLDQFGHVNAKNYVDIVSTVRLRYMEETMKMPLARVLAEGFGFFMSKSVIHYKRPITGLRPILCNSHVAEIKTNSFFEVAFDITSEDGKVTHADGVLEIALVDLKTKRPTPAPTWILDLFFK